MARTNKTEYAILGLLTVEPMSGYDIKAFIAQSIGFFWQESYGQIYPALKRLLAARLISRRDGGKTGRHERQVYSITALGRKRLRAWMAAETEPERVRLELLLKLFFGPEVAPEVHIGQIESLLAHQRERLEAFKAAERGALKEYRESPYYEYWYATLRYGVHITKAREKWCQETLANLRQRGKRGQA